MQMQYMPGFMELGIIIFWLLAMCAMAAVWVFIIIALWRAMKAHESVAQSLKDIAATYRSKP